MSDRDGQIWYDGKLVPWRDATTHVLTHSLHYGLAVFEGLRAYKTAHGTAIFRLQEHTERLLNSAHIFMMKMPYDKHTLIEAQKEVVRVNQLESCYVRPIAFYGSEKMGVSPRGAQVHVAIAAWPWGAYLGADGIEKGIRVKTSAYARHHITVTLVRAKFSGRMPTPSGNQRPSSTATGGLAAGRRRVGRPKARAITYSSSRMAKCTSPSSLPL